MSPKSATPCVGRQADFRQYLQALPPTAGLVLDWVSRGGLLGFFHSEEAIAAWASERTVVVEDVVVGDGELHGLICGTTHDWGPNKAFGIRLRMLEDIVADGTERGGLTSLV